MRIANTMEIRLQNAIKIIQDIESNLGITNIEIAQKGGLSVPTISNIVTILKNNDMVMTVGTGESSGGRRPIQLSLNPKHQYSIGVSIARHTVYLLLIDFECRVCEKEKYYLQFEEGDAYWNKINCLIKKMQEKIPIQCEVGIALPGFVDYEQNIAFHTHTLGVSTVSLESIYKILGKDVLVGDSCRLAAMAQVFAKPDVKDHFFVLLSRRVSGILIQDGSIFKLKASSLDVGAMLIDQTVKRSVYGTPGSFLELCSASRIIDIIKEKYDVSQYEMFFEEIEKGNQEFTEIWDYYLKYLSIAIYNIYAIFKLDIVIGGEMAKYVEPYLQQIHDRIKDLSIENTQNLDIHCSVFGEYDEAYGAALESRSLYLRNQLPEILKNSATAVPVQKK